MGAPGAPGPLGQKGEPGPKGDCNCTDGEAGSPGQKGDKGDKGVQGQMGPAGPIGLQGQRGDMGPMGIMGTPGPCMPAIQSAFSAGLMEDFPPPNAPVVFSEVIYNPQGSYNPTTGIFTAPVNGTYVFQFHVTVNERILKVGIFHNFKPVIKTTSSKDLGTTSHAIVLHLAMGDRVWIQVKDNFTNGMIGGDETSSTFSGFLLHPDTCEMPMNRVFTHNTDQPDPEYSWGSLSGTTATPTVTPTATPTTPPTGDGSN